MSEDLIICEECGASGFYDDPKGFYDYEGRMLCENCLEIEEELEIERDIEREETERVEIDRGGVNWGFWIVLLLLYFVFCGGEEY